MTTPHDETPVNLTPDLPAPDGLEQRVLRQLRKQGLIRRATGRPGIRWLAGAIAATLAAFAAGWASGRAGLPQPIANSPTVASGLPYLLLLSSMAPRSYSSAERRDIVREYTRWAEDLDATGRLVSAEELADGGVVLWRDVVKPVQRDENTPAGFFLVTAKDSAEALAIARDSPHWRRGGTIAIRQLRRD